MPLAAGVIALDQNIPIVLVIEDDDSIQTVVEDALSDAGVEPAIAPSGEEAVTLLKGMKNTYRALVTDIGLRGKIDGWEVAQQARQIDPEFPIVYISGKSAAEWPSKGVPNSIMLPKPFAPAQLVTAIANLLNRTTPTTQRPCQPVRQVQARAQVRRRALSPCDDPQRRRSSERRA